MLMPSALLTSSLKVRTSGLEAAAKVTSKGQVIVPKAVRDALGMSEGDEIVFGVEGGRAVLAGWQIFWSWRAR
jgi:AbrB family looped-hinge helix DNA binding protein